MAMNVQSPDDNKEFLNDVPKKWAFHLKDWNLAEEDMEYLISKVQLDEQKRIRRFHFDADKKRALIGRLMLRYLVLCTNSGVLWERIEFTRSDKNKPVLLIPRSRQPYSFNISHHGDWVVLVWHDSASVGVDLMDISPPGSPMEQFFETMKRSFHPDEWKTIRSRETDKEQLKEFYRHWTMKESYIKAIGQGLSFALDRMCFCYINQKEAKIKVDDKLLDQWHFYLEDIDDEHCVAVASAGVTFKDEWKKIKLDFDKQADQVRFVWN